ncbi:hypothetical protein KI688_006577 [Linnemannia hyalina]|uniref:FAD-binding domain-containing protein n=1 Tax=Linnemannia hyalina TaxID=64524 RepID=A0A9P8BNH5_9FUNG|nr:hypothetical protein KI688_006577 [Linnemannia hyalina]
MEINPAVTFVHERSVMHAKRPKVLIVGAGLGGLALGMILEKSDTPYEIFERAPEVKPLGSAISLTSTSAPLFKQLGLWDELLSLSKELDAIQVVTHPGLETAFIIPAVENAAKRYGAEARLLPRPILYDLMLRQIPKERIHLGKKILSTQQGGNSVLIRCTDRSEYEGDILVGADGAYSAVRQNLYAQLKMDNKLPASDALPLPFTNVCLVGQTRPLTLEEFPDLAKAKSQFKNILSKDKPYAWITFTTEQSSICYLCIQFLDSESSKDNDAFKNSEWGPEAAQAMCNEVKDFPIVSGGEKQLTLGDLFNWSSKDLISKVMLEEKIFKTWGHCRTVLMGDGGEGGNSAFHDAITLANYIHALPDHPIAEEIEDAFKLYKKERISWVEDAFSASQAFRNMVDAGAKATITRFMLKKMPKWVGGIIERKILSNRPQIYFLPRDETPVIMPPAPQASLHLKRPESKKKPQLQEEKIQTPEAVVAADDAEQIPQPV